MLYISENIFATVQNRPVFAIAWLNGASKKTDLNGYYFPNHKRYGKVRVDCGVSNRKPLGAYWDLLSNATRNSVKLGPIVTTIAAVSASCAFGVRRT